MSRARRKQLRIDEFLARPEARNRIEAVGERLAENNNIRLCAKIFNRPEFSGAIETHLDFVVDQQDLARFHYGLELFKVARRRNDIPPRTLNGFHKKRGKFSGTGFRIPDAVILGIEQSGELVHAVEAAVFALFPVRTAKAVGKRD